MSELTDQSWNVRHYRLLEQREASHYSFTDEEETTVMRTRSSVGLEENRHGNGGRLPFMMYSFSAEPGRVRALNRLLSSCSVKGAISAGEILTTQRDDK